MEELHRTPTTCTASPTMHSRRHHPHPASPALRAAHLPCRPDDDDRNTLRFLLPTGYALLFGAIRHNPALSLLNLSVPLLPHPVPEHAVADVAAYLSRLALVQPLPAVVIDQAHRTPLMLASYRIPHQAVRTDAAFTAFLGQNLDAARVASRDLTRRLGWLRAPTSA